MKSRVYLAAVMAGVLSACGGGGGGGNGGGTPPPPPPPTNNFPTAEAGQDYTGSLVATGIEMDGTGSSDPDGDALSFSWRIQVHPTGADVTLENSLTARPTLQTLFPGLYVLELEVDDGRGGTSRDTVALNLSNDAPTLVLDPTPGQIAIGLPAGLNASGSTDANGHPLSYQWTLTSAPAGSYLIDSFSGASPLVEFDAPGDYRFDVEVSDGFDTDTGTVSFQVSTFTERVLEDGFDHLALDIAGVLTASAMGSDVRVVSADGSTAQTLSLPAAVIHLAASPDGEWLAALHANQVSIIELSSSSASAIRELGAQVADVNDAPHASVTGTWPVSIPPGDMFVDNDGIAHIFSATDVRGVVSINPTTGIESTGGTSIHRVYHGTQVAIHPSGLKAYGADNGLSPDDIERYDIAGGIVNYVDDSPYHGVYSFCGDLWIASSGTYILTRCGTVVRSSDDPSEDMTFYTQLAVTGTIRDAAYEAMSGRWYVVEEIGGDLRLNAYDGAGGQWLETIDLPEILPGRQAAPLRVNISQGSDVLKIFAVDDQANPQSYALFSSGHIDQTTLDNPPVTVVASNSAGYVGDAISLDASASYDPEGADIEYSWALVSEPDGSDLVLTGTDQSLVTFTPTHIGEYVMSVVTSDGDRTAASTLVTVQVVSPGTALQIRLSGTPSDVAYNKARNQLLYADANESELRIRNLDDFGETVVILPRPAIAIDVSPDGNYAVASHPGLVSLIELQADGGSVVATQVMSIDWGDIVVDDQGRAYTIPNRKNIVNFYAIDFDNDSIHTWPGMSAGTHLRMSPAGGGVYAARDAFSTSALSRFTVTDLDNLELRYHPYYRSEYRIRGDVWINETSDRLVVAGGHFFRVSTDPLLDMLFVQTLPLQDTIEWADHSQEAGRWAIITDGMLQLYSDATYALMNAVSIDPLFIDAPGTAPSIDRVYFSDDGNSMIVIAHSDQVVDDNYVVQIIE